jgi:FKBP-type peptidyl-prolyl cis-trans isomerase SlpA
MQLVKLNDTVKVHYTGTLNDGQIFDSSLDREPLEFKVGSKSLIPGFENAVIDMALNESKKINIPSDEAYGPYHDEMLFDVKKEMLPKDMEPQIGMQLVSQNPDGSELIVTITKVNEDSILVDANHPLAGKDLTFEIKVVEIA